MVNSLSVTLNSFHFLVSSMMDFLVIPGRMVPFKGAVMSSFSPRGIKGRDRSDTLLVDPVEEDVHSTTLSDVLIVTQPQDLRVTTP